MAQRIVNINGSIKDEDNAQISVFDRGFLYGDSLYEVVRTYGQKPFQLKEHLARLAASAKLCRMDLDQSLEDYAREMTRTLQTFFERSDAREAYCRLIITRGIGQIGMGKSAIHTPTQYVVMVQGLEELTQQQVKAGIRLHISRRIRNHPQALDPAMKSGNYLNSLLAFLEANEAGLDDAVMCNFEGHLTEGTTFNLYYVKRGMIGTAPLDIGILDGITRRDVIRIAKENGFEVREVRFPAERLLSADEIFISSTLKDVFPVTQINNKKKKVGPITLKLREKLVRWARSHP